MYNPSYLILSRHNIYYFRYPFIKIKNKISYIYISLATREPKKALLMAKSLEYYASIISKMYDVTIMKDYELKKIIGDYLKTQLEAQKKLIDVKPYYDDKEEMWDWAIEKVKENPVPITENIINKLNLKIQKDSDDFKMIHAYIHRNLPDYHESLKEYNNQAFKVGLQSENIKKVLANHKLEDVIAKFLEASKTESDPATQKRPIC